MTDGTLEDLIRREFEREPGVVATHVRVVSNEGAVTLSGRVKSYMQRRAAVQAARCVPGVRSVRDELRIEIRDTLKPNDAQATALAEQALSWSTIVPHTVHAEANDGFIKLTGAVAWSWQRTAARNAVGDILGVKGVLNEVIVKSHIHTGDAKQGAH